MQFNKFVVKSVPFNSDKIQTNTVQVKVYPIIKQKITKQIPRSEFKTKLVSHTMINTMSHTMSNY